MLKIAICDDEKSVRETVKKRLDDYAWKRNLDIEYCEFSTGLDFLQSSLPFNLVILDYQLNEDKRINGINIAKKLRESNQDIMIIFLTSFSKVVFSSFKVDTFRFLVKPLQPEKLFSALDDLLRSIENHNETIIIKLDGINTILNVNKIRYLEGMGKHSILHTDTEDFVCHEILAEVEKRLPKTFFFRCHRSFIVNFNHVTAYDSNNIFLTNNQTAAISKKKLEDFKSAFISYSKRHRYL